MIFARRAGVVLDPSAPRAVPRPTDYFYYDTKERKKIEAFLFAKGWTLESNGDGGRRKKYISPEGKGETNREIHTLNVVLWYYFPEFLKVNSQERAAELAWLKAKEEKRWKKVQALYSSYSAEQPPPLRDSETDDISSSTPTPNGGTSYRFIPDAEGLLKTMTSGDWEVQEHQVTRRRRYIPPDNLATSSEPYYSLLDVAHDFYHSFLTTFTHEPLPVVEPQPHAKAVSRWVEQDKPSDLCIDFQNITLTYPAARMDIDEDSNETNPFTAKWTGPLTPRFTSPEHGGTSLYFHPDDPDIDTSGLSGEYSLNTSRSWRSMWPPGGLLRRLENGDYVNITRLEDARVGDLYVIQDGLYEDHTLYVSKLLWGVKSGSSRVKDADVDKFMEDGILPAACDGKAVVVSIKYSFLNPLRVNHTIPTCNAWAERKFDGTAFNPVIAWKEMLALRPYGLWCSLCDNYVGKPVFSKDGKLLYYQTVTQFEQDGVDPRHKIPNTVGIPYREWELCQGISEWKCCMCHRSKSVSELLRPDEKHLASGTAGAWPYLLPPWKK